MSAGRGRARIWLLPAAFWIASAVGLFSALVADGVWDALSWVALAAPVGVCVLGLHRAFR